MRARTAKERAVEDATRQYIRPRTEEEIQDIHEAARPHYFARTPRNIKQNGVWCSSCGGTIEYDNEKIKSLMKEKGLDVKCPHCGAKLKRFRGSTEAVGFKLYRYYNIVMKAEVYGPWQVLRYYYVGFKATRGADPTMFYPIEIVRRWYNVEHGGRCVVWSTGLCGSWYGCGFNLSADLTLKREDKVKPGYYGTTNYRTRIDAIVKSSAWHRILRRDGFKGESTMRLLGIDTSDIPVVFSTPQLITLYKTRRYALLRYYGDQASINTIDIRKDWPSLKVALRHGYEIKDICLWHDYIEQLRELGEDTTSPHWICPENLRLAHDRSNTRVLRLRRLKEIEREKKLAADEEADYAKRIRPFRDLRIQGAGVVISVIPSVEDVRQEGHAMHHCVFTMRYYKQESTLLLSARDEGGNRLETIEFSLERGEVVQSRAVCNGTSKKHSQILKMMKGASDEIMTAWKRARTTRPDIRIKPVQELVQAFV